MRGVPIALVLLVLCACASEHPGLAGHYAFSVAALEGASSGNVGEWSLAFLDDGTYRAKFGAGGEIHGVWRVDGDRVLIEDRGGTKGACSLTGVDRAAAVYRWRRDGSRLTLEVERDECGARREVLAGTTLDAVD